MPTAVLERAAKKAVFIDGASLAHMLDALGIIRAAFKLLFMILRTEIGSAHDLAFRPVITLPPHLFEKIGSVVESAGFEVLRVTSRASHDDVALIRRIQQINPTEVSEIVMVSSDQDFIPALMQKRKEGVTIYWVATRTLSPDGTSAISGVLERQLEENFVFVELAKYRDMLDFHMAPSSLPLPTLGPPSQRNPAFLLEVIEGDGSRIEVMRAIKALAERYPRELRLSLK